MGKFGRRFMRRAPALSSKMGNKNFYKGRGARNEGTHTSKGAYVVRPERLLRIAVPSALETTPLRPYVHTNARAPARGARVPAPEQMK